MKISGFTFIKNAVAYDFPVVESVRSVLPVVDEFIIVAGDSSDGTDELLKVFDGEPKVRIIRTVWDTQTYDRGGMIYAQQTDVGLRACTGDWCLYIQSDEIMHHDALPVIREACAKYLDDRRVEGFLLKYVHLYGDYRHYIDSLHFAYPREIRIVRNRPDIHSWRDAQSFRVIPDFNGVDYDVEEGTRKLRCILLDALIFHYGWSRDPRCMVRKANHHNALYSKDYKPVEGVDYYDYGNLGMMPLYEGTFPEAAAERMAAYDWADFVRYDGPRPNIGKRYGVKYRVVDFIEKHILRRVQELQAAEALSRYRRKVMVGCAGAAGMKKGAVLFFHSAAPFCFSAVTVPVRPLRPNIGMPAG